MGCAQCAAVISDTEFGCWISKLGLVVSSVGEYAAGSLRADAKAR